MIAGWNNYHITCNRKMFRKNNCRLCWYICMWQKRDRYPRNEEHCNFFALREWTDLTWWYNINKSMNNSVTLLTINWWSIIIVIFWCMVGINYSESVLFWYMIKKKVSWYSFGILSRKIRILTNDWIQVRTILKKRYYWYKLTG